MSTQGNNVTVPLVVVDGHWAFTCVCLLCLLMCKPSGLLCMSKSGEQECDMRIPLASLVRVALFSCHLNYSVVQC